MAITKSINWRGFEAPDAYIKASMFQILPPNNSRMEFQVSYSYGKDSTPFDAKTFACDFDIDSTESSIAQRAYEYLKTLPEFEGATDC